MSNIQQVIEGRVLIAAAFCRDSFLLQAPSAATPCSVEPLVPRVAAVSQDSLHPLVEIIVRAWRRGETPHQGAAVVLVLLGLAHLFHTCLPAEAEVLENGASALAVLGNS